MATTTRPLGLTDDEIRAAVRERYSEVGTSPDGSFGFRVGRAFAEALGYPKALLDQLLPSVWEAFTGVATPSLIAPVRHGDTVVDLGCGAGLDLALLGWRVGPRGRVVGIDFAEGMVQRAQRNVALLELTQADALNRPAEDTGLPTAFADGVVANGILNLSPDKSAIVREVARILRPGGQFLLAETTLAAPLAESVASLDDWFR